MASLPALWSNAESQSAAEELEQELQAMRRILFDARRLTDSRASRTASRREATLQLRKLIAQLDSPEDSPGRTADGRAVNRAHETKTEAAAEHLPRDAQEATEQVYEMRKMAVRMLLEIYERQAQIVQPTSQD
jgi:hypothetical protein